LANLREKASKNEKYILKAKKYFEAKIGMSKLYFMAGT